MAACCVEPQFCRISSVDMGNLAVCGPVYLESRKSKELVSVSPLLIAC